MKQGVVRALRTALARPMRLPAAAGVALVAGSIGCEMPVPTSWSASSATVVDGRGRAIPTITVGPRSDDVEPLAKSRAAYDLHCPLDGIQLQPLVAFRKEGLELPLEVLLLARGCNQEARYACYFGSGFSSMCVREPDVSPVSSAARPRDAPGPAMGARRLEDDLLQLQSGTVVPLAIRAQDRPGGGVSVISVLPDGRAQGALRVGDVILEVNGVALQTTGALLGAVLLGDSARQSLRFSILRDGATVTVTLLDSKDHS